MAKYFTEHEAWKFLLTQSDSYQGGLCTIIAAMRGRVLISSQMFGVMLKRIRNCKEAKGKNIGTDYIFTPKTRPKFVERMVRLTKPKKEEIKVRDFENFLNMLMSAEIGHAIEADHGGWIVHIENEHYTSREDRFVAGVVFDYNGRLRQVIPGIKTAGGSYTSSYALRNMW